MLCDIPCKYGWNAQHAYAILITWRRQSRPPERHNFCAWPVRHVTRVNTNWGEHHCRWRPRSWLEKFNCKPVSFGTIGLTIRAITSLIAMFMRPIWGRQDPCWPHVGSMNFTTWVSCEYNLKGLDKNVTIPQQPLCPCQCVSRRMPALHRSDEDFLTFFYIYVILFINHTTSRLLLITLPIFWCSRMSLNDFLTCSLYFFK